MNVSKYRKIKDVTLPLLKVKVGEEYYVKFTGPIHLGKEMAPKAKVDPRTGEVIEEKRAPAHIATIKNLETGENGMLIVATVMRKELEENYPGESYIGKSFGFVQTKVEGKSYNLVEIWEVAEPEPEDAGFVHVADMEFSAATDVLPIKNKNKK